MEILSKLGIDWRLLLAQIVNFAILLFLLNTFLTKPLLAFLDQRKEKIEKGLKDAEEVKIQLAQTEKMREEMIQQAKKDAKSILEETLRQAEKKRQASIQKTKDDITALVTETREKISQEREEAMREAQQQLANLVTQATRILLQDLSDKKISDTLAVKALAKIQLE